MATKKITEFDTHSIAAADCLLFSNAAGTATYKSTTVYGRIYRNGVAVGTIRSTNNESGVVFTEDISGCVMGDAIEIYAYTSNASHFAEISGFLVQVASCYPTGITTVDN